MTDPRDREVGHRLGRLMHQLHGVLGPSPEDVVDIDLPVQQLRALLLVARSGPISVGSVADATGASLASTSSLTDRLARSGHVQREPDPTDRRRVLVSVTPAGRDVVDRFEARFHERFERLVEAMRPDARIALEAGLTDMLRAAEALGLHADRVPLHRRQGDHA